MGCYPGLSLIQLYTKGHSAPIVMTYHIAWPPALFSKWEAMGEAECPATGQMPNTYSQRQRNPSEASWCLNPWMPQGTTYVKGQW